MLNNLAFIEKGAGPVLLLLHGYCESKEIWNPLLPTLAQEARVLAPDLPGFGENEPIKREITLEVLASRLMNWLQKQEVSEAHIVGHSLGGYIALALAERYPQILSGLCLFHSTAKADTDEKKKKRSQTYQFIQENGVEVFAENFIPSLFAPNNRHHLQNEVHEVKQLAKRTHQDTALAVMEAMRNRPARIDILKEASYPCMFIAGSQDEIVPYADLEEQSKLPNHTKLASLQDCGHMGMYERPEESARMLLDFLKM
ncbi:MAG: alpha/beta fold hydrolase [Cyclobacteriaceae bacterium]